MKLNDWQRKLRSPPILAPTKPSKPVEFTRVYDNAATIAPSLQLAFNIGLDEGPKVDFSDKEVELLAKAGRDASKLVITLDKDLYSNEDELSIHEKLDGDVAIIPLQRLGLDFSGGITLSVNAFFHDFTSWPRSALSGLIGERSDMIRHVGIWMEAVKHDLITRRAWPFATRLNDSRWPHPASCPFELSVARSTLNASLPAFPFASIAVTTRELESRGR